MQIEPLGNRVLVKRSKADDTTPGGIVLPQRAKDIPQQGVVVAVGEGEVKVQYGDLVIFKSHAGQLVQLDNKELLLLDYEDILAKVNR
jgi:chaperonin GroES